MSLLSDSRFRHPDERLHVHVDLSPEPTIQADSTIVGNVYSAKRPYQPRTLFLHSPHHQYCYCILVNTVD